MKKLLCSVLLLGMSSGAFAQSGEDDGPGGPPRWGLGIGALVKGEVYAGEGSDVIPIPLVSYNGERFFFQGITAGWKFIGNDSFELAAIGRFRLDGFSVDDLGQAELARNGIDHRLLEDRDRGFDLGVSTKWMGRGGEIELEFLTDVTDKSGGHEMTLQYGYPFQLGKGRLTPQVGVTWQSDDMANYYYGTLPEEVARGVVDYKPDAITTPFIGFQYFRPLGEKWSIMALGKISSLPDEIKDSPLVERDTSSNAQVFVGFSRGF